MPVVGLVVNLVSDSLDADRALKQMIDADCLTLGPPPEPSRIPVVLETETDADSRQQLRWLNDLPGVIEVQVVTADFSDLAHPGSPASAPESSTLGLLRASIDAPLNSNPTQQGTP